MSTEPETYFVQRAHVSLLASLSSSERAEALAPRPMIAGSPFPFITNESDSLTVTYCKSEASYRCIYLLHVYVLHGIVLNCKFTLRQLCGRLMTAGVTSAGIFRLPFIMSANSVLSEADYLPC